MSEKHSLASKKRWSSVPFEERSRIGKRNAAKRWVNVDAKDRRKHALAMVRARKAKVKKKII